MDLNQPSNACDGKDVALRYLHAFCKGDIDKIESLLLPDLVFEGPYLSCNSSEEYIAHLRQDPPESASFRVLNILREGNLIVVVYEYVKLNCDMVIEQEFQVSNQRIDRTVLRISKVQDRRD